MLIRNIFLFLLGIQSYISLGQSTVKGIITSENTKNPVPFATITTNKHTSGICADERGFFQYDINDSLNDTLIISCLGYETLREPFSRVTNIKHFVLKEKQLDLPIVTVRKFNNYLIVGALREIATKYEFSSSKGNLTQIALLIKPNSKDTNAYIKSVGFFISHTGSPKTPFRIRVYTAKNGLPNGDLIGSSLITSGNKKGGWTEMDISNYNLQLPAAGLFVAMEWLYLDRPKYFQKVYHIEQINTKKILDKRQAIIKYNYGQHLCLTDEFDETISYTRTNEGIWKPYGRGFMGSERIFSPMIRMTILTD